MMSDLPSTFADQTQLGVRRADIPRLGSTADRFSYRLAASTGPLPDAPGGDQIARASAASAEWAQRVGGYTRLPLLIHELGLEPATILDSVGLSKDALDQEGNWIPYACLGKLLFECAQRSRCAHFGLLAGRMSFLSDLGALGELVRNSASVGDALNALAEHQHLNSEGGATYLTRVGGSVELGYAVYHPNVVGSHQLVSTALAANFTYLRELCGPGWAPSEVLVPLAKPHDIAPYRNLFRVTPRFSSEVGVLRFSDACLSRRVAGADALRLRAAREQLQDARRADLVAQVYGTLRIMLLGEQHAGDIVAQRLGLHRRTLNRRLRERGTTFQEVLDNVRFTLARELLSIDGISLDDVAAALGYSGVSPFMRTFYRWAGTTPGRWRRAAAASAQLV